MELEGVEDVEAVRHQGQLGRHELSHGHQVEHLRGDARLVRVVTQPRGHVAAPVRDEDGEHGAH